MDARHSQERLLKITLHETPVPKPRMTQRDKWLNPPRPGVARWYYFRDRLWLLGRSAGLTVDAIVTQIYLKFYLPMPEGWSTARKNENRGQPHLQTPDTDNLTKAVKDALMRRDETVWSESAKKFWDDGGGPRVEISLYYCIPDP